MKMCKRSVILVVLGLALGCLGNFLAVEAYAAAKAFPEKELSCIAGMAAGGGRDILCRGVGKIWTKYLGVPVVTVNMPGAGGLRAASELNNSAPDGHTLMLGAASEIGAQILEKQDFDTRKFSYVGRIQSSPQFIWVKSDSPFRSLKDFKTFGKPLRMATMGTTNNGSYASVILARRENFDFRMIAGYTAAPPSLLALIRGEAEFVVTFQTVANQFWRAGQIRPILSIASTRPAEFPDIPTVVEMGYPEVAALSMNFWLMGPPGIPPSTMQLLDSSLQKTLQDKDFLSFAKGASIDVAPLNSQETTKLALDTYTLFEQYKADIEKFAKVK